MLRNFAKRSDHLHFWSDCKISLGLKTFIHFLVWVFHKIQNCLFPIRHQRSWATFSLFYSFNFFLWHGHKKNTISLSPKAFNNFPTVLFFPNFSPCQLILLFFIACFQMQIFPNFYQIPFFSPHTNYFLFFWVLTFLGSLFAIWKTIEETIC